MIFVVLAGGSGCEPFRSQITSPLVASMMIAARAVRRGLEAFAAVAGTIATSKAHASHCVRDTVILLLAPAETASTQQPGLSTFAGRCSSRIWVFQGPFEGEIGEVAPGVVERELGDGGDAMEARVPADGHESRADRGFPRNAMSVAMASDRSLAVVQMHAGETLGSDPCTMPQTDRPAATAA